MRLTKGNSFGNQQVRKIRSAQVAGQRYKVDTSQEMNSYTERVKAWILKSRAWMLEKQIAYHLVMLDDPFEQTLRDFLIVRKKLAR
jgi:hypothetical protein